MIITPSFLTGDVKTVEYRDDLGIELMLSSLYMPYKTAVPLGDHIALLVQHAQSKKKCHLVLGCDANAHYTQLERAGTNIKGESIFDFYYS